MDTTTIHMAASSAYQAGMSDKAAELYDACAKQAERASNICELAGFLRWKGNSLMWAGQYMQSQAALLEAVSFDGHPQASAGDIYGALTDLCLLALQTQPFRVFRSLLQDTKRFLERRGLNRWRHRTDNLEAIACYRRGRYEEAFRSANRAWQEHTTVPDGPHYQDNSYLYYMFRAAHGMRDLKEMGRALALLHQHAEREILTGQLRLNVCEMLRLFAQQPHGQTRDAILGLAEETLSMQRQLDPNQDEEHETMRMLAVLGEPDKAEAYLRRTLNGQLASTALLRLDIALSRAAGPSGWMPPQYLITDATIGEASKSDPPETAADPLPRSICVLLRDAEETAAAEDGRMECKVNGERVAVRRNWLETVRPKLMQPTSSGA